MNKRIVIGTLLVIVLVLIAYGLYAFTVYRQAETYSPGGFCGQAITRAKHDITGITYNFPSTCIPDGWSRSTEMYRGD
jgi:hypothetical protein